jgi:hypothetical protein
MKNRRATAEGRAEARPYNDTTQSKHAGLTRGH